MRPWQRVLGVPVTALLLASPAPAITIVQVGADGAPAMDGGAAVAFATSDDLGNSATATGGAGGSPGAAATTGGAASASADTQNLGFVIATATATGGAGGNGLEVVAGGPGGAASAAAFAETSSGNDASVSATATGGPGGNAYPGFSGVGPPQDGGAGGGASLGRVYGASRGGGNVYVQAVVAGGDGGDAGTMKLAGAGASVALQDAVDGETTGALFLRQRAVGGNPGKGASPVAGSAESSLTYEKSTAVLDLVSEAIAGGRNAFPSVGFPFGSGAGATALAEGTNHAGPATTRAAALAGTGAGGDAGGPPTGGGAASVRATATTTGDGHAARVGEDPDPPGPVHPRPELTGARGGAGGPSPGVGIAPGSGGGAASLSIGSALGDSSVYVFDYASGGNGGGCTLRFSSCERGADGGEASSQAIGEGAGHSRVEVHALAAGGYAASTGLDSSGLTPRGGDSIANASASGLGEVHVTAEARAGPGSTGPSTFSPFRIFGPSGDSRALAIAEGSSGSAAARATASEGPVTEMALHTGASLVTGASVQARANAARPFDTSGSGATPDVVARATAVPLAADTQQVLDDHPGVEAAFTAAGVDQFLALGRIDMLSSQFADEGSITLSAGASFEIIASTIELPSVLRNGNVWIAFFAPELAGDGFESLRVRVSHDDASVLDLVFTDPDAARGQLDQLALDLGAIQTIPPDGDLPSLFEAGRFTVDFDLVVREGDDAFSVGFLVGATPIPEPSTLLLVALGLAALAMRRKRA